MNKFLSISALLFLVCCSSTFQSKYDHLSALTDKRIISEHNYFSIKLPQGWYKTSAKDESPFELWLNVTDYSKSMMFIKINHNYESEESLYKIFNLVKSTKLSTDINSKLIRENEFSIGRNVFYSFEYKINDRDIRRTIVFVFNGMFFEFTAMFDGKHQLDEKEVSELFSLQNSLLISLNN